MNTWTESGPGTGASLPDVDECSMNLRKHLGDLRMRKYMRLVTFAAAATLSATLVGLAGCEQRTAAPVAETAAESTAAVATATDSRTFMTTVVQPPTQVLWDFGYTEKMSDEDWAKVSKAANDLVGAMPTIAAGGLTAEEKARAQMGGWQDWSKKTADFATAAKQAADQKNQMNLATAGDSLVETCGGCHMEFDPNAKDPGASPP